MQPGLATAMDEVMCLDVALTNMHSILTEFVMSLQTPAKALTIGGGKSKTQKVALPEEQLSLAAMPCCPRVAKTGSHLGALALRLCINLLFARVRARLALRSRGLAPPRLAACARLPASCLACTPQHVLDSVTHSILDAPWCLTYLTQATA
jgi:hypothetical protein